MKTSMIKNSIQDMMITEILIKLKKLTILTINLTSYKLMNGCQNKI